MERIKQNKRKFTDKEIKEGEDRDKKIVAFYRSLDNHKERIIKVSETIHDLIVENQLSVRDARIVLDHAIDRIERYSHVVEFNGDFVDIHNLLKLGRAPEGFPVVRYGKNQNY